MGLTGKGFFTWKLPNCENGQPGRIAQRAADAGLSHVLIKIADGADRFGDPGLNRAVVEALRERGIQTWGWHYVYGREPAQEAAVAIDQVKSLAVAGYCLDAEAEYTQPGRAAAARTFVSQVRAALPGVPLSLSSYRYPSMHSVPWSTFLGQCDYNMPQVYWEQAHNPDQQLARSVRELLAIQPQRPVFPTGAAYGASGWVATPADIRLFLKTARNMKLAGINMYSWDYAGAPSRTAMWDAVAAFDWPPGEAPPEPPAEESIEGPRDDGLIQAFFDALNAFDLDALLDLYHPNAAHVTARRTVVGRPALREWYAELVQTTLRGGAFTLGDISGNGAFRRVAWAADSYSGHVEDGNDALGLRDGLIQYHFTHFTVQPN